MKRTRIVEIPGQEATWTQRTDQESSRTVGSVKALSMAINTMGNEVERTTQRAAHAATRNE
jgi:hypothetical protein